MLSEVAHREAAVDARAPRRWRADTRSSLSTRSQPDVGADHALVAAQAQRAPAVRPVDHDSWQRAAASRGGSDLAVHGRDAAHGRRS